MDKRNADTLALNFAMQLGISDPAFFSKSGPNVDKAELLADFVKTLSQRLQADIHADVDIRDIKLR